MSSKIRILHCLETIYSGGVERRRLLLTSLDPGLFEQKIICTRAEEPLRSEFIKRNVELIEVGTFKSFFEFKKYRKVRQVIKSWRPHIVHGAVFEGVSMATLGSVLNHVPVLITEETSDPSSRSAGATWLLSLLLKASDFTIGISPSVCVYLTKKAGVRASKLRLINNGVITPEMPLQAEVDQLRRQLGFDKNDFIVGTIGRIYNGLKKFSDLIIAVAILKDEIVNLKLLIVGDGQDLDALIRLAKQLGVADKVVFAGFQADTRPYYAAMNVFALASVREGFGLVIAEAMFFKLPVVATAIGGIKDIVVDNKTGFLVNVNSPEQLAAAIKKLYLNPDLREKFGKEGYERAMREYTSDRYVRQVESLYLEACRNKQLLQ